MRGIGRSQREPEGVGRDLEGAPMAFGASRKVLMRKKEGARRVLRGWSEGARKALGGYSEGTRRVLGGYSGEVLG